MTSLQRILQRWYADPTAEGAALRVQQVQVLAAGTPTMALGNLFNAAITVAVLWEQVPPHWLLPWWALVSLAATQRLRSWSRNRNRPPPTQVRPRTLVRATVWSLLIGLVWGLGVLLFAGQVPFTHQIFLAFVVGGQAAAGAAWLGVFPPAFLVYLLSSMVPLIVGIAIFHLSPATLAMNALLVCYTAVLVHAGYQGTRTLRNLVRGDLEREELLRALERSRADLETQVEKRTAALTESNRLLYQEVSERKRVADELRGQQTLLRAVMDAIPMRVAVKDRDGNRLFANRLARALWNIGPDDPLPPGPAMPHLPAAEQALRRAEQRAVIGDGRTVQNEHRRQLTSGREEWVRTTIAPVRDHSARITGSVIVTQDVTEEKLQELELANFFELSLDLYCIAGRDGRFHRMNPAMEHTLGVTQAETGDRLFLDWVVEDDRERTKAVWQTLLDEGAIFDFENRIQGRGETVRWISWRVAYDATAGLAVAVGRDITDAKRVQEELESSRRLLQAVFDTVPSWLFVKDLDGRYLMANRAMADFYGFTPEAMRGLTVAEIIGTETAGIAQADALDRQVQAGEALAEDPYLEMKRPDGKTMLRHVVKLPLHDEQGQVVGIVGTSTDITEQVRLEQQLRQAQKMEAVGQLAGGVAHDFNNMLQVIQGFSQVALSSLDKPDKVRSSLERVVQSARAAAEITRRLLAFSRQDVLQPQRTDLNEALANLVQMMERLIGESIRMDLRLNATPMIVVVDVPMLEQAVVNLCVNARDAMPGGGTLTISTRSLPLPEPLTVRTGTVAAGQWVTLEVADTGSGMAPEVLERIFEPFYTTKESGKGTGLGLSIVYGFVEEFGGQLDVMSNPATGTGFTLYLPAAPAVDETQTPEAQAAQAARTPAYAAQILVAEDEPAVRMLLADLLARDGHNVLEAVDGEEAIRIFDAHAGELDLVLLDMVMPKCSGRDVYEHIAAHRPELPVLFSTGYADDHLDTRLLERNAWPLLRKPYAPDKLLGAVHQVLAATRADTHPAPTKGA